LWNTHHHPDNVEEGLNQTLKDLQTDYLDLYLVSITGGHISYSFLIYVRQIHWPVAFEHGHGTLFPINPVTKRFRIADVPVADTWAALEKLVKAGKIRSIGVSNFTIAETEKLLKTATIPPAVNQIEAHPYLLQPEVLKWHKEKVRGMIQREQDGHSD
jgi:L-glyceraldehyde reductase